MKMNKKRKISLREMREEADEDIIFVYTDGSCFNNGSKNKNKKPIGGIGVWFGDGDKRNVSELLEGKQTNNRAELTAIIRALEILEKDESKKEAVIFTDSEYTMKSITEWIHKWKKNGWKTSKRKPVENPDLIKKADRLLSNRERHVNIRWVHAHSNIYGNEQADSLAKGAVIYKNQLKQSSQLLHKSET